MQLPSEQLTIEMLKRDAIRAKDLEMYDRIAHPRRLRPTRNAGETNW